MQYGPPGFVSEFSESRAACCAFPPNHLVEVKMWFLVVGIVLVVVSILLGVFTAKNRKRGIVFGSRGRDVTWVFGILTFLLLMIGLWLIVAHYTRWWPVLLWD
jgi:uncharacterized membrane protein